MKLDLSRNTWHEADGVSVCGFCYDEKNHVVSGPELARHFSSASTAETLSQMLKEANGQFAVVVNKANLRAAAVDRIRSIPLYYDDCMVGDQPYGMSGKEAAIDRVALMEYRASGNTFAGKTLIENISQIPAGAMVTWQDGEARTKQYWTFLCRREEERHIGTEELRERIEETFRHTHEAIEGRHVAIPISGGYDSRLIATMLKRKGIVDALCYHIGRHGSDEERFARASAEALGFRYILLDGQELSKENANYLEDPDFENYYRRVGDYTNFVWLYEYFGLRKMISEGEIEPDTVFIPGHSGDFLAGSHIHKGNITPTTSAKNLAASILLRNFEYRCEYTVAKEVYDYFKNTLADGSTAFSAYQWFIMQNRQAQQIVNSTKVYGHFGHASLLPLWDNALTDLFRTAHHEQLRNCGLYNDCVRQIFAEMGLPTEKAGGIAKPAKLSRLLIKRTLHKTIVNRMVRIGDETGEEIMCQPMLRRLVETGFYPSARHFTSSNEIIKDWYEHKVVQNRH